MTQAISSRYFRHLFPTDHSKGDHIQSTGQNHLIGSVCAQEEACIISVELWLFSDRPFFSTPMHTANYQPGKHSKGKVLIREPYHESRNISWWYQRLDRGVCFRHEHGWHQEYLSEKHNDFCDIEFWPQNLDVCLRGISDSFVSFPFLGPRIKLGNISEAYFSKLCWVDCFLEKEKKKIFPEHMWWSLCSIWLCLAKATSNFSRIDKERGNVGGEGEGLKTPLHIFCAICLPAAMSQTKQG